MRYVIECEGIFLVTNFPISPFATNAGLLVWHSI